jgi:hypothetical protein
MMRDVSRDSSLMPTTIWNLQNLLYRRLYRHLSRSQSEFSRPLIGDEHISELAGWRDRLPRLTGARAHQWVATADQRIVRAGARSVKTCHCHGTRTFALQWTPLLSAEGME